MPPKIHEFPRVWYVSVDGDDNTGDGTKDNPFASVKKAIESASSGDGIFISRGIYRLIPMLIDPTYHYVGIYDMNKALTIWGENEKTVLEFYGSDSTARDGNLFRLLNENSLVTNLTFHFYPGKSLNYSNAIFLFSNGEFRNLLVINKGTINWSYSYYNDGPANTPKVYNCIFQSNGRSTGDYSGSPLYVNCLFDRNPSNGAIRYSLTRTITNNDWNRDTAPSDLIDKGDPSIFDPDGTISDIGVIGGLYAWYSRLYTKFLIKDGNKMKAYDGSAWVVAGDYPPNREMFEAYGMDRLEVLNDAALRQLSECQVYAWTNEIYGGVSLNVSAVPGPVLIKATEDLSLADVERIDYFTLVGGAVDGVRIVLSIDGGQNWISYNGNSWIEVDINNLSDVKENGMSVQLFNSLTSEIWNNILSNTYRIRFAYYLEVDNVNDVVAVDDLVARFDMRGIWRKAVHGEDYDFEFLENRLLRILFLSDGSFKVNYTSY